MQGIEFCFAWILIQESSERRFIRLFLKSSYWCWQWAFLCWIHHGDWLEGNEILIDCLLFFLFFFLFITLLKFLHLWRNFDISLFSRFLTFSSQQLLLLVFLWIISILLFEFKAEWFKFSLFWLFMQQEKVKSTSWCLHIMTWLHASLGSGLDPGVGAEVIKNC